MSTMEMIKQLDVAGWELNISFVKIEKTGARTKQCIAVETYPAPEGMTLDDWINPGVKSLIANKQI